MGDGDDDGDDDGKEDHKDDVGDGDRGFEGRNKEKYNGS